MDGEEGVKAVLKNKPDVMIVNVMTPKRNSYQVLAEVKEKFGDKTR